MKLKKEVKSSVVHESPSLEMPTGEAGACETKHHAPLFSSCSLLLSHIQFLSLSTSTRFCLTNFTATDFLFLDKPSSSHSCPSLMLKPWLKCQRSGNLPMTTFCHPAPTSPSFLYMLRHYLKLWCVFPISSPFPPKNNMQATRGQGSDLLFNPQHSQQCTVYREPPMNN